MEVYTTALRKSQSALQPLRDAYRAVLRPLEEQRQQGSYAAVCPCLCGFKLDFVTEFPLFGGAAILDIGC